MYFQLSRMTFILILFSIALTSCNTDKSEIKDINNKHLDTLSNNVAELNNAAPSLQDSIQDNLSFSFDYIGFYQEAMDHSFAEHIDRNFPVESTDYNEIGMFSLGINGIDYFTEFLQILARRLSITGWVNPENKNELYTKLTGGIPLFLKVSKNKWEHSKEFNHVNPEFIKWIEANVIPDPTDLIGGFSAKEIYHFVFEHFFRIHFAALQYLKQNNLEKQAILYHEAINSPNNTNREFILSYLNTNYNNKIPNIYSEKITHPDEYITTLDYDVACGFWLRRQLDGSAKIIAKTLFDFMANYDKEWIDNYSISESITELNEGETYEIPLNYEEERSIVGDLDKDGIEEEVIVLKQIVKDTIKRVVVIIKLNNQKKIVWKLYDTAIADVLIYGDYGDNFKNISIQRGCIVIETKSTTSLEGEKGFISQSLNSLYRFRWTEDYFKLIGFTSSKVINEQEKCSKKVDYNLSTGDFIIDIQNKYCKGFKGLMEDLKPVGKTSSNVKIETLKLKDFNSGYQQLIRKDNLMFSL